MTAFHITYHFIINFIKFQLQQRQDNASFYTHRYFATSRTSSVQKCWEMCTVMTVTWNLSAGLGVNNTSPSLVTPLSPPLWSAKPSLPPTGLKRFVVTCFRSCHSLTDSTLSAIILCRAGRPVAGEVPLCEFYILLSIFLAWKCSIKSSCIIPVSTSASYFLNILCLQQHNLCSEVKTRLFETTAHCDKFSCHPAPHQGLFQLWFQVLWPWSPNRNSLQIPLTFHGHLSVCSLAVSWRTSSHICYLRFPVVHFNHGWNHSQSC